MGINAEFRAKRAKNRETARALLTQAGIPFEERNHGAHLLVEGSRWNLWPSAGRWTERNGGRRMGTGVLNLIELIKEDRRAHQA